MTYIERFEARAPVEDGLIIEGDIIFLGPSGALAVEVMAIRGDKAWIRDLDGDRDGVIPLARLRRFGLGTPEAVQ